VFDLGYYDYVWWAELDQAGCRIVTRCKINTPLTEAVDRPLEFARLVRANLMHRKRIDQLLKPKKHRPQTQTKCR